MSFRRLGSSNPAMARFGAPDLKIGSSPLGGGCSFLAKVVARVFAFSAASLDQVPSSPPSAGILQARAGLPSASPDFRHHRRDARSNDANSSRLRLLYAVLALAFASLHALIASSSRLVPSASFFSAVSLSISSLSHGWVLLNYLNVRFPMQCSQRFSMVSVSDSAASWPRRSP